MNEKEDREFKTSLFDSLQCVEYKYRYKCVSMFLFDVFLGILVLGLLDMYSIERSDL